MNVTDLLPKSVLGLFDLMEIAEEEIAAAKEGLSKKDELRVHDSFCYLRPTPGFTDRRPELYRQHCREITRRIRLGAKESEIDLGTKAEVLIALSEMSMIAPLGGDAPFLYAQLFRELLPDVEVDFSMIHERYQGSSLDLLTEMQKKLSTKRNRREDR